MSWVLICDECYDKPRKPIGFLAQPHRKCANCGKPIVVGKGNPWRTQEDPTTPSSGNATD
jgi:hypothetical protein